LHRGNSPLNSSHDDGRLETVATRVAARAWAGNLSCQGNPSSKPKARGNDFNAGNHEFVGDTRQPQRRKSQVGNSDDECPAAIEKHEIDGVRE
jgi:hypothetical protein